jgi:hypothetical protein
MVKHEPEARRTRAKSHVAWCNEVVHKYPWTRGDVSTSGGIYIALEKAEQAYLAHGLPYKPGLSHMDEFDPRRFRWVYDQEGEADDCVKLLDTQTNKTVIWLHW